MTDAPPLSLAADFDPPDESMWRALVEAGLKGQPFDRLITRTADGLSIPPVSRYPDAPSPAHIGLPGQAPFTRGACAVRDPYLAWDIRQAVRLAPDCNRLVLEELSGGASSILLTGDSDPALIAPALEDVLLNLAPIALACGGGLAHAKALVSHYRSAGADPHEAKPDLGLDPIAAWMRAGGGAEPVEMALAAILGFAGEALGDWPKAKAFHVSCGRSAHEAGATATQELAIMLAGAVELLRQAEAAGMAPETVNSALSASLSVGPDLVPEIAKLRAARRLWARMLQACGVSSERQSLHLQAHSSLRMMTRDDAWTNALRTTASAFSAAVAGADSITIAPLTAALGEPDALARRLARNTQLILMEESHLGRVADPAGGAYAIEKLTADVSASAWATFQGIESQGGLIAALRKGELQTTIAQAHATASAEVARRKRTITGVSDFPQINAQAPGYTPSAPSFTAPPLADRVTPLPWCRLAEPFERLREKATGAAPVFLATLGSLADFSPRANFTANLLAAGGIQAMGADTAHADEAAIVTAFAQSGCDVVALCGSDGAYATQGESALRALKAAGARWVLYAGKPVDEAHWRTAGVDQFVFAGQDIIDALTTLQTALGIKP